jgi:hypothetical protein
MVHEVPWTEEVDERRRAHRADHAGLEVEEHRAWCVLATRGLVVKNVDAVELRFVVTAVLAVAADAVFVAHRLLKLGAETNLNVGLRRHCRGQTCSGMLGAMARVASARPATPLNGPSFS